MNILQVLTFMENALQPAEGGKFSIQEDSNKITVSVFTYKKEMHAFGPTFIFVKEFAKAGPVYTSSIKSDLGGITYKLTAEMTDELFESIVNGLRALDGHYMKDFERMIASVEIPEIEKDSPVLPKKTKSPKKPLKNNVSKPTENE